MLCGVFGIWDSKNEKNPRKATLQRFVIFLGEILFWQPLMTGQQFSAERYPHQVHRVIQQRLTTPGNIEKIVCDNEGILTFTLPTHSLF